MSAERPDSPPFVRVLEALDLDSQTLGQPVDATFIPGGPSGGGVDPSLDSLPRLALDDGTESTPELALEGVLGEGGRGEVRLAQQLSLRRQVAVKSLKGVRAPGLTQELLREARITGGLEHPNIVPVYALGRDAQNRVMLVMRKVNGAPWGRLLREQGPARTDADLERQLEIFRQVCHAVEFAHSQGIVHRDLKPDNVMIGGFGEVVVLDWGLAASLDGDAARELPRAADLRGLAGTPSYMAPELVRGEGGEVGRWTDVYLLGATLHEIVMGAPPHRGGDLAEVLERAFKSAPAEYPPEVPAELAVICRKAMAADPKARFAGVAELREAVHAFGRHRQSAQLADEAAKRLQSVDASATPDHQALAQSRFGFEQALRTWPENPAARAGLQQARTRAVELEVAQDNLAGAERALAELEGPQPALREKVEALRQKLAARAQELEQLRRLERELDPEATRAVRNAFLGFTAIFWCVLPVGLGLLEVTRGFKVTWTHGAVGLVLFAALVTLAGRLVRGQLYVNRMGRRFAAAMQLVVLFTVLTRVICWRLGLSVHQNLGVELLMYGAFGALGAVFVDIRFASAATVYAVGGLLAAWRPDLALFIGGFANLLALLPMAVMWARIARPECDEVGLP